MKALRAWSAAYAKSINARDYKFAAARPYLTSSGLALMGAISPSDRGLYFPGPLPFTPTKVTVSGETAVVLTCAWSTGWAQNRKTKLPAQPRRVDSVQFTLKQSNGWKLDSAGSTKGSCSSVSVKGVGW